MAEGGLIEQIPEDFPLEAVSQVGSGMIVTGTIGFIIGLARGKRGAPTRTGSIFVMLLGLAVVVAVMLLQREVEIDETQSRIMDELDELDPIARAQVLKSVAQEQLKPLTGE